MDKQSKNVSVLVISILILLICCLCVAVMTGIFLYVGVFKVIRDSSTSNYADVQVTQIEAVDIPTRTPLPEFLTPQVEDISMISANQTTLEILENTIVPVNDPIDLAKRLQGKENLQVQLENPGIPLKEGATQSFWVTDSDTNKNSQVQATLSYITDHVYFWVQEGVEYNKKDLKALVDTFEQKIYPTNREFFGSEWTPGVDADPHLYILYTKGMGGSIAGYFSSADEYLPQVRDYSNGHEMFLLSADHVQLDEDFAYSVLAHEFQHMIHWYRDRNEETWMNEGASDLAAFLNKYDIGGHDIIYAENPDIQLTDWPTTPDDRTAHYGSSFLFMAYFLDRFGENATKTLVSNSLNGMKSIDQVLSELNIIDPITGEPVTADDVFVDWVIGNYLQDETVGDGRFNYNNYPSAPDPAVAETLESCPVEAQQREVSQYGVDYIRIRCPGEYTLGFKGLNQIGVLPVDPFSGSYTFYSNRGDESDMTLTRSFDFRNQTGPLTLSYMTWYDLEEDYDYAYVTASTDGENWTILTSPSGTVEDPSGNSYGWAYNGKSGNDGEWIKEEIDISQFSGKEVQLRFEYITDAAVNGEGLLLDDISIPEIGYFSDFEVDDGGWLAEGFVRIHNSIPQTYRLGIIRLGDNSSVEYISLSSDNKAEIPLEIRGDTSEVILVVTGTTRHTRLKAPYQFQIKPR